MEPIEYVNMARIEEEHFWFVQTRAMVRDALEALKLPDSIRILDLGCGTGGTIKALNGLGRFIGLDVSEEAANFTKKKTGASVVVGEGTHLPFKDSSFDVVTVLDVLEHIDDDLTVMKEIKRVLKPNGYMIATVPAHQYLFSTHDRALHHVRRYSKREFLEKLKKVGFVIHRATYTNMLLFTPIAAVRLGKKLLLKQKGQPHSDAKVPIKPVNSLLSAIMGLERRLMHHVDLPYGVSLMVIARV